jgi:hypothetical protein
MTKNGHDHQHSGDRDGGHTQPPYWKRAHHDWRFLVGVFFMFAAIIIYVMSEDLALRPRSQRQEPQPRVGGK